MAKRNRTGEPKPRRVPTRRSTEKPTAEATPFARRAEPPESPAGEAGTSRLMTGIRGEVPAAGRATERGLAGTVAQAASSREVSGSKGAKPDPEAVARRAFELFLARGGMHGHDVEDWLAAEHELSARGLQPRKARA